MAHDIKKGLIAWPLWNTGTTCKPNPHKNIVFSSVYLAESSSQSVAAASFLVTEMFTCWWRYRWRTACSRWNRCCCSRCRRHPGWWHSCRLSAWSWIFKTQVGSHKQYVHPVKRGRVTIPFHFCGAAGCVERAFRIASLIEMYFIYGNFNHAYFNHRRWIQCHSAL